MGLPEFVLGFLPAYESQHTAAMCLRIGAFLFLVAVVVWLIHECIRAKGPTLAVAVAVAVAGWISVVTLVVPLAHSFPWKPLGKFL